MTSSAHDLTDNFPIRRVFTIQRLFGSPAPWGGTHRPTTVQWVPDALLAGMIGKEALEESIGQGENERGVLNMVKG